MFRGIEIAAQGMASIIDYNDIIANNLANINTPGFKQLTPTFKNIHEMAINGKNTDISGNEKTEELGSLSAGSMLDVTHLDFNQGSLIKTDGRLDVALNSEGFFAVETKSGEDAYTRNGGFSINEEGDLTTRNGDFVLGENGRKINLDLGANSVSDITIMSDGRIMIKENELDKLKVINFEDPSKLKAMGNTLFKNIDENNNRPQSIENYTVAQGYLESSNASVIESMINSITGSRTYETLAKVISNSDSTIRKAVTDVGRVMQ